MRKPRSSDRLSSRYYLWTDDGPWRISQRTHVDLVTGAFGLPQYANSKQKVVEVLFQRDPHDLGSIRARGIYYHFDEKGRLNLLAASEAAASAIEGSRPRHVVDNLFDIGPAVRHRRWVANQTWKVSPAILRRITADLRSQPSFLRKKPIPLLRFFR